MSLNSAERSPGEWVLLSYRMPREPSTPRIAVWRKLKRLGVAQLADGVVALPADARTREHLEWLADEVVDAGGTAGIWIARPATTAQERELARSMASARAEEYRAIIDEAGAAAELGDGGRASAARRLRAELRRVTRRDYFPPGERDEARQAVETLAQAAADVAEETR
ncbi:chromate resistance protein [Saccharopolyspora sp. K220]|uniref:Chromate resistance protein ChrB n=1 Tax=Saccharopolyspora soli TaxID=2926618 RepID=UPI001F56FFBF|nr:Chromate resistance protein ChrB [Saccharopolyspora soli]MCI2419774.1 chromate resistance protein [Saccharopolyspora soli]